MNKLCSLPPRLTALRCSLPARLTALRCSLPPRLTALRCSLPPRLTALRLCWLFAGLFAVLPACGAKKKIEECQALVATINTGVEAIHKTMGSAPGAGEAVSELRALATEMDNIAKATGDVAVTQAELPKLAERYQQLTREVAAAARELADAVDAVDVEKITKLQTHMEETVKREDPLVEDINKFCQNP